MKPFFFLILLVLQVQLVFSQEPLNSKNKKNSIYAEAFGQGFCWSLNYDRILKTESIIQNSFSVGLVNVPKVIGFGDGVYYGIPISYNLLFGKKNHHFELGLGLTNMLVFPEMNNGLSKYYLCLTPKVGYRFQKPNGGLFLKVTANLLIDVFNVERYKYENGVSRNTSSLFDVFGVGFPIFPWPGLSIGYTLKKYGLEKVRKEKIFNFR
jgi:hypothetical protein